LKKVKANGVEITSSIADLLEKIDCVLLETNDGRLHLEQAVEVFKSGKICYIDKPIGATLGDAIAIYEMAEKYNAPVFSIALKVPILPSFHRPTTTSPLSEDIRLTDSHPVPIIVE